MADPHLVDFRAAPGSSGKSRPPKSSKTWTMPVSLRSRDHGGKNLLPRPRLERGVRAREELKKLVPKKRQTLGTRGKRAKALIEVGV